MSGNGRYLGPAGIFSTDDPLSDMMQIEAERYYDEFEEEDDRFNDPYQEQLIEVVGCCMESPDWYDSRKVCENQVESIEDQMWEKHQQECLCGNPDNFRFARLN